MEIGSHTASHRFPPRMAFGEIESELVRSKERIETMLGRPPIAVALPFSFPIAAQAVAFLRVRAEGRDEESVLQVLLHVAEGPGALR